MAATWELKIDVIDLPERLATVTGTRTDGPKVTIYSLDTIYAGGGESLAQAQARVEDLLWQQYVANKARTDAIEALISTSEAAIKLGLDAREVA